MSLVAKLYDQFREPRGVLGQLAGRLMAARHSNRQRNSWTVALLDVRPSDRVLEIGYGPGLASAEIGSNLTTGRLIGIDHSATMQRMASRRSAVLIERDVVDLRVGDTSAIPTLGGGFQRALSVNVVQFWKDPAGVFATLHDALTPGGRLAITYQPRHRGAVPDDAVRMADRLVAFLEAAGFANPRYERLELKPIPVVCALAERRI